MSPSAPMSVRMWGAHDGSSSQKREFSCARCALELERRVREMTYDNAEDYLVRAQEAAN